jgi:nucleoside-diphosphate-sugar epimerase
LKVLVTGSCGYVGSLLCPQLLAEGYEVVGYDTQWFGDGYWSHSNEHAKLIKGDIRDIKTFSAAAYGCDAVIHLACISNDTCCQLDEALSTRINYDAFEPLVEASKRVGVRRFIYCSSSSVYGVSHEPDVTEDHPLIPLTLYNKYKGMCEPLLFKHQSETFECVIIRPATVCGYAPRQRFDLTVNVMTRDAVMKKKITVFGGEQKRPNLHIKDMCDVYKLLLTAPKNLIQGQTFNVGAQNMKVKDIARLIQEVVQDEMGFLVEIETQPSTDNRSYHINSEKIYNALGFKPKRTVEDAITDLCIRFQSGQFKDALSNPLYTNILQLIEKKVA